MKQTDFDGKFSYSKMISITSEQEMPNINIYPNPTDGKITVEGDGIKKIEISEISGRIIKLSTTKINAKNIIDISSNPKGLYFVKIVTNKGLLVQKIILE